MSFEQRLADDAAMVEHRLSALLAPSSHPGAPYRLLAAMRHAALGQGKRFRPFLVMESARLFGVAARDAVDAAAALECVHCYSLVHDDLPAMDNDELRRGAPTVWKAFDEWTAILAGDALLTLAFEILAAPAAHPDPAVRSGLIAGLARASGAAGMVGGQGHDLAAEKLGVPKAPDIAHVRQLQAMKTGALIKFGCEAGAIIGQASPVQRNALGSYGAALGLAFQIADDLLDVEGDAAVVGKAVAKDAALNKATLVAVIGPEMARRRLHEAEAEAVAALDPFGPGADTLRQAARFAVRRQK